MMNRKILLTEITENPEIKGYCKKICRDYYEDLLQDIAIVIMEYPKEKIKKIRCPQCFIISIITNMVFSKTSPFHYKYRKTQFCEIKKEVGTSEDLDVTGDMTDDYLKCIHRNIADLYWFDRRIMQEWMKTQDLKKVGEKYKISHSFVFRTVTKIKKNLKRICL